MSVFETTINYTASMLSVYELRGERAEDRALVDQAQEVADKLAFAWFQVKLVPSSSCLLIKSHQLQDNDIPFGHTDEGDDTGSPSLLLSQKREHCYWNGRHLANIALAEKSFRHIINMVCYSHSLRCFILTRC